MLLKFTSSGHLFISPQDNCHRIVDAMLTMDYKEEFCIAQDFNFEFVKNLMEAGFLVMSADLNADKKNKDSDEHEPFYILLPKLHYGRSALFFENLHVKKSIRRLLKRYELHSNHDFEYIVNRCIEKHGDDWLTPPLVKSIKMIRAKEPAAKEKGRLEPAAGVYPTSFALYREGKLAAGEFGIVCGKVYTSYSGFYEEANAGTVQLILTARYLQEAGFRYFDLGMPLHYKNDLGAVDIDPCEFVALFRGNKGQEIQGLAEK